MPLRSRIVFELSALAVATVLFLTAFPRRRMALDVALAGLALGLVAANAGWTRRTIWSRFPTRLSPADARRAAWRTVLGVTFAALALMGAIGAALAWREGGGAAVAARLGRPGWALAILLYLPWALLQQTLFQFYLLGRLRVAVGPAAIVVTGLAYSLVHLPDAGVTAATAVAGVFWSWAYWRWRSILPLALSHAMLGASFYYWIYDKDLAARWLGW